ncbi:MAG: outer membrane protein transport protein [Bdellovibrionota bacterium]
MLRSSVQFSRSNVYGALLVVGAFAASAVNAAGFEKNVLWSGKYQGYAGAAASSVDDSEAMFFNPAGLASVEGKGDIHLNFSPTFSKFSGPVSPTQGDKDSKDGFSPVGALTSAYRLNDRFVLGAGVFVSGGTNTTYEGINAGGLITSGEAESTLRILDFTVGAATKVTNEFSLGVAWRMTYATAALSSVINPNVQLKLKDLSALDFASFRAGAQYRTEGFGLGLSVRTPVKMSLEGDAELSGSPTFAGKYKDATVAAEFPFLIALGGDYQIAPKWKLFSEVSWANYAANQKLDITATAPGNPTAGAILSGVSAADIKLKWKDQWVARLGTEWQALENWAFRAGYAFTSQVTSKDYAKATLSPPGIGHTFTLGTGTQFGAFKTDLAFDYSMVDGDGQDLGAISPAGSYTTRAYAAHLGVAYNY